MVFPKKGEVGSGSPEEGFLFFRLVAGSNFILTGGDLGSVEAGVATLFGPVFLDLEVMGGPGGGGYIP